MKIEKLTLLLVIIITTSFSLSAQIISGKNSLSLSMGPSIPIGDFSGTDAENIFSGYAKTGGTVKLSYNYKLTEILGLEAMVYGQRNALNTNEFEKQLDQTYFFQDKRNYSNWQVEKDNWMIGSFLAGVTGKYSISHDERLFINAKALAGYALIKSPDSEAVSKSDNTYATFTGKYGSSNGVSVLLGAGLNYQLNKQLGIYLNSEYFKTGKISFKESTEIIQATDGGLTIPGLYTIGNSRNPPISFGQIGTREQIIQAINIQAGFTFSW